MVQAVGSHGTLHTKRRTKDPVRVAAGTIAKKHSQQGQIRSRHLGFDCYYTGQVNGQGRTRIIQRRGHLPTHLTPDVVALLPTEMWWPARDHTACHALIEAVLMMDLSTLASWKSSWPDHEFGFERYMELVERHMAGIRNEQVANGMALPSKRTDGTATVAATALFPGVPQSVEPHGTRDEGTYIVRTWIVRFNDGEAALRVDVKGVVSGPDHTERVPCTRAYVDLVDGRYEIIEHYPGRLRALGLPVDLIYQVLGVPSPTSSNRRQFRISFQKRPHPETPREHSLRVTEKVREAQTLLMTGDPTAPVIKERTVRPDPIPMAGNARYERQVARDEGEVEFERFPDAPGRPVL